MTEEDETPQGFDKAEEEWIKEQRSRDSERAARSGKGGDSEGDVNINSLMDIMVILLVFLLKSFGDQPVKVTGSDLQVPKSTTKLGPEDMMTITVTRNSLMVNDEKVADVPIDDSQKKGGEAGLFIIPLMDKLNTVVEQKKQEMQLVGKEYKKRVTLVADQTTRYRLLTEVLATAGKVGLKKYKFAVVKNKRKTVSPVL